MSRGVERAVLVWGVALSMTATPGCACLKSLVGENTISLETAEVRSMSVDIRRAQKTICPRAPVQMAVFVEAKLEDEEAVQKLETWEGDDSANKNDKLDFSEFAFHSDLGTFDESGWFSPDADLMASVDREFELVTAYRRRPDQFTFTTKYKPDYACIRDVAASGGSGSTGASGDAGARGQDGRYGSSTEAGGDGSAGSSGAPGGDGSAGAEGPRITAHVTKVKTAYYDELVAVHLSGAVTDLLLFPPEQTLTISARGGAGGAGGSGGPGGAGGSGGGGNPGGRGGDGGAGGGGARGGAGGPGGWVELIVDDAFPGLRDRIQIDVSGGPGGAGGAGGPGGQGGSGGSGTGKSADGQSAPSGAVGSDGAAGASGSGGPPGAPGKADVRTGDVAEVFAAYPKLTRLAGAP